jgi:hypothetical protein
MRVLFAILFILPSLSVQAEYRVFILKITDHKNQKTQTRYSTMDPLQYKMIYPLSPDQSIDYVDTWKCKGNTSGFKILCAKPPENKPQN